MANNLYRKQKRQYSTDNGVTWKDVTPAVYQVGALIETNSDCSAASGSIQYRWFAYDISDQYTCDTTTFTKYNLEVLQYSYDGITWLNTTETRQGSQRETNSCDCGYTEEKWNLNPNKFTCSVSNFNKYGVEVLQVGCGDYWQNVEPYQERETEEPIECYSLDCGASSNELAFTWDSSKYTRCDLFINGSYDKTFNRNDGVVDGTMNDFGICSLTSTTSMFLYTIGTTNLFTSVTKFPDTTYVTNMSSMFSSCSRLTELDVLTGFNTSNVTNMSGMFILCSGLTLLDLSSFDTSNVTNMSGMFDRCYSLTSIDLSSFNTSNITNMNGMFRVCTSLTSLDLSSFNTSNVTNMNSMFDSCTSLTSLDLSSFNTSNVTDMGHIFYGCNNLKYLNLSGWDLSNVTDTSYMFDGCNNLEYIVVNDVNCYTYKFIRNLLASYGVYCKIITNIFDCDDNTLVMSSYSSNYILVRINGVDYTLYRGSYEYDSLTTERFTNARGFISGSTIIERIDEMFDTSYVTDMYSMFGDCNSLVYINTRNMNTSNVTNMARMFYNCRHLTKLNLSDFDTSNVVDMSGMFENCTSLTELNVSGWNIKNVTNYENMFNDCMGLSKLIINNNYDKWCEILTQNGIDCNIITMCENGYNNTLSDYKLNYEHNAVVEFNEVVTPVITSTKNTTIVLDDCTSIELPETETMIKCNIEYVPNDNNFTDEDRIVTCNVEYKDIISESFTFTQKHFDGDIISYQYEKRSDFNIDSRLSGIYINGNLYNNTLDELKLIDGNNNIYQWDIIPSNIGVENINRIKFHWDITSLLKLKVDSLNDMRRMFEACYSLKNVNFDGINTSNVTDMGGMFNGCSGLTSLDLSSFNTSNVTNMAVMFQLCSGLTSLDLSSFNTSNVTDMSGMFNACKNLTSLDLSSFNTSNVTDMSNMFNGCGGLKSLDLSHFNTSKVDDMSGMFYACRGLTSLDLSGWDLSFIYSNSNTFTMFNSCVNLTTIYCYNCNQTTIDKFNNYKPDGCTLVY